VLGAKEACDFVKAALQETKDVNEVAKQLCNVALDKKSSDNVTVIILKIKWNKDGQK
jgi:serine/threonine protein phosphatase PrpC